MIPPHMIHLVERTRITFERREAAFPRSDLSTALAPPGCAPAKPRRGLRCLVQRGRVPLASEKTVSARR